MYSPLAERSNASTCTSVPAGISCRHSTPNPDGERSSPRTCAFRVWPSRLFHSSEYVPLLGCLGSDLNSCMAGSFEKCRDQSSECGPQEMIASRPGPDNVDKCLTSILSRGNSACV